MIKVGDWVKVENEKRIHHGMIGRVKEKHNSEWYVQFEPLSKFEFSICKTEDLQKLPIKFKGFDIVDGKIETTKRYSKLYKQTLFFIYDERIHLAMIIGINFIGLWKFVDTPEQARDWLELQYATMLAKARGLV